MKKTVFDSRKPAFLLSLFAVLLFIYLNSFLQGAESLAQSEALFSFLDRLIGAFPFLTHHFVRKLAHFLEYTLLGAHLFFLPLLFCAPDATRKEGKVFLFGTRKSGFFFRISGYILLGAVFASLDEALQHFVPGRFASPKDVLLDTVGIACGLLFSLIVSALFFTVKRKDEEKSCDE